MGRAKQTVSKSADAYRSIGEAASEIGVQTHVLRYWEGRFPKHIKPVKRRDGRRMFRPADMHALRAIRLLVHECGMTLKGAGGLLEQQGVDAVLNGMATVTQNSASQGRSESPALMLQAKLSEAFDAPIETTDASSQNSKLESVLHEMNDLKARLDAARMRSAA